MDNQPLPAYARRLDRRESFRFSCHPGAICFNECCRQLDLALSPYDVLRLKRNLGLSSEVFLARHAMVEEDEHGAIPRVFLSMRDDASCPFVAAKGCTVYPDRSSACRLYPVGRAACFDDDGLLDDMLVLMTENHCQGFAETATQNVGQWIDAQGLAPYLAANDAHLLLTSRLLAQAGAARVRKELDTYLLALYNLDEFRLALANGLATAGIDYHPELHEDDEDLLLFAAEWLLKTLPTA